MDFMTYGEFTTLFGSRNAPNPACSACEYQRLNINNARKSIDGHMVK